MRHRRLQRAATLMLLHAGTATACSPNWKPVTLPQSQPIAEGTIIEFRAKDQLVRLHSVHLTRDSVDGIPWLEHLSCDTCRVSYSLADVTQLRTGNPGAGAWYLLTPIIAIVGFGLMVATAFSVSGYHGN